MRASGRSTNISDWHSFHVRIYFAGYFFMAGILEETWCAFGGRKFTCNYITEEFMLTTLRDAGLTVDDSATTYYYNIEGVFLLAARKALQWWRKLKFWKNFSKFDTFSGFAHVILRKASLHFYHCFSRAVLSFSEIVVWTICCAQMLFLQYFLLQLTIPLSCAACQKNIFSLDHQSFARWTLVYGVELSARTFIVAHHICVFAFAIDVQEA